MSSAYDLPYLTLSDSSAERRFHVCQRRFEFAKLYGHARADSEGTLATEVGHCLHRAYQDYLIHRDRDHALWVLQKEYPIHLMKSSAEPRSLYAVYATFEQMLANSLDARYTLAYVNVNGEQRPAVEVPCRIIFKDVSLLRERHVPIYWDMFIDAILFDTLEQRFVVADVKSTQKVRYDYSQMFMRDPQCLPYAFIIEKVLGQPAVNLPVIYLVAFIDLVKPQALKYEFVKTANDIREWAMDKAMLIYNLKMMANMQFFPRRGKNCDDYRLCQYSQICDTQSPDTIKQYLHSMFGPMDYVKKEKEFKPWFELELTIEGI